MGRLTGALAGSGRFSSGRTLGTFDNISMEMVNIKQAQETFKFLGDINRKEQTRIETALRKAVAIQKTVTEENLKTFFDVQRPDRFKAGVKIRIERAKKKVPGAPTVFVAARGNMIFWLEFGTRGRVTKSGASRGSMPASRFFTIAARRTRSRVAANIKDQVKKVTERIIKSRIKAGATG